METLASASEYIQNDLSIFPLIPRSKKPLLISWEQYQRRYASNEQIEEWFSNGHAENNIAIVTGKISRVFALDIDGEEASNHFNKIIESFDDDVKTALEYALCIRTGSGNTNIVIGFREEEFSSTDDKITNTVLWRSENRNANHNEIRLKGEGGYIVAPPSIHPYEIINGSIATITTLSKIQIYQLISAIKKQAPQKKGHEVKLNEEDVDEIVAILKPYYRHGNRNDFTMYLSGWMRKEGIPFDSAIKVVECIAADDEEKLARIRTLEETYKKESLEKVCGYSGLLTILVNQTQNGDEAKQILEQVTSYFPKAQNGKQSKGAAFGEEQKSESQILLELAHANVSRFFKDQHGIAYALIVLTKGRRELIALESGKFRRFLAKLFYDNNNIARTEHINNAIQILQANIEYDGQTIPLSLRLAWKEDAICYDLTDEKWRYVKITKDGWEVKDDDSSVLFARYNQVAQVPPDRNYEPEILDKFIGLTNIKDDKDNLLLKVYTISLFIPDIAHAMLIVHGEKGAAKTLLKLLIKQMVDPSKPALLTMHTNRDELVQQLSHNYVAYYDNVKNVPKWLPDEVCKAATGIGQTKRKLYTNDEDIVYEYKRCLGFSGINICFTEPDALDRSILIELMRIPRDKRKLETEILAEFEQIKPKVLGYIFDVLVRALQIRPNLRLNDLPRMADFALWGEAISQAMRYDPLEFINAYYENIGRQNIEAIEANPLGQAISKFCEQEGLENKVWEGSPGTLLKQLNKVAESNGINTTQKMWPRATNSLTRRIKQIQSNLLEGLGIKITISRDNRKNTSTIRVNKEPPLPPEPPKDKNQSQEQIQTAGGTLAPGGLEPPIDIEPPTNSLENHAQNTHSGGTGGNGGILPTLIGGQGKWKVNKEVNEGTSNNNRTLTSSSIYRLGHSDTFACHNCKQRGDKWFMQKHLCTG
jgi:hypothetical protein